MSHTTTSYVRVYLKSAPGEEADSLNSSAPGTEAIIIPQLIDPGLNHVVRTQDFPSFCKYQSNLPCMK